MKVKQTQIMIVLVLPDIAFEDELLAEARRGNQEAIMDIYERYADPIYQYIRLRLADQALAEDLASEVFLELVAALQSKNAPRHSLRGWLFKVARNLIARHYKDAQKMPQVTLDEWIPDSSDNDPEVQFMRTLSVEQTRRALHMLKQEQQEVLILRFGQKLNLQETADIMGKSVSAIKSLQFRAIDTLRHILGIMQSEQING